MVKFPIWCEVNLPVLYMWLEVKITCILILKHEYTLPGIRTPPTISNAINPQVRLSVCLSLCLQFGPISPLPCRLRFISLIVLHHELGSLKSHSYSNRSYMIQTWRVEYFPKKLLNQRKVCGFVARRSG